MERPFGVLKKLRTRLWVILCALVVVILGSEIISQSIILYEETHSAAINDAGRQRMLTVQLAAMAYEIIYEQNAKSRETLGKKISDTAKVLNDLHESLEIKASDAHPVITILYGKSSLKLDQRTHTYIEALQRLANAPVPLLTKDNPDYRYVRNTYEDLVASFDNETAMWQALAEKSHKHNIWVRVFSLTAVLLALAGLVVFALRPTLRLLSSRMAALNGKTNTLEKNVFERTQELRREIAEHETTEAALANSEGRFRDFAESASDWLWEMGPDLRFTYFSSRFEGATGVLPHFYIGKTRRELGKPDVDEEKWAHHLTVLNNHKPFKDFRYKTLTEEGEDVYFSISGIPLFDDAGVFRGYRGTGTNITEITLAEQELLQARDTLEERVGERTAELKKSDEQLRKAIEDMAQAKTVAEKANHSKSEFLASMSHELRTPLNAILGFSQLLEYTPKQPLTESQREYVRHIIGGGNHLLKLIDQVLQLAQIEAGKVDFHMEDMAAGVFLFDSLGMVSSLAEARGVVIEDLTSDHTDVMVRCDAMRLKQVILNLMSNAVKYNRDNGTVTLAAGKVDGGMLRISVSDTGLGIPPEKYEKVFQPFSRLGAENSNIEGTGIGLTISKQLIEMMGGRIGFESVVDEGSKFWLEIPLSGANEVEVKGLEEWNPVSDGKIPQLLEGAHKVLYVEDNPENLAFMEEVFSHFQNITLVSAQTAEEGIKKAGTFKPDIILMDLNLPGIDGTEALRRLRGLEVTLHTPIIAVTASAMPGDADNGLNAGFNDYLTKPLQIPKLIEKLNEHME